MWLSFYGYKGLSLWKVEISSFNYIGEYVGPLGENSGQAWNVPRSWFTGRSPISSWGSTLGSGASGSLKSLSTPGCYRKGRDGCSLHLFFFFFPLVISELWLDILALSQTCYNLELPLLALGPEHWREWTAPPEASEVMAAVISEQLHTRRRWSLEEESLPSCRPQRVWLGTA